LTYRTALLPYSFPKKGLLLDVWQQVVQDRAGDLAVALADDGRKRIVGGMIIMRGQDDLAQAVLGIHPLPSPDKPEEERRQDRQQEERETEKDDQVDQSEAATITHDDPPWRELAGRCRCSMPFFARSPFQILTARIFHLPSRATASARRHPWAG